MKLFVISLLSLFSLNLLQADSGSHGSSPFSKTRPLAEDTFGPDGLGHSATLTADEVNTGKWKVDESGACDLEKGCPYVNKTTGETRYLPDSEKKKLKTKTDKSSAGESAKTKGLTEIATKKDFEEAFKNSEGKKAVVMLFSASDCGPCDLLKTSLKGSSHPNVGIFTATRPTYRTVSGHELHEEHSRSLGNSVPVAFIYTKDENGKWQGKPYKNNQILPAIKALD